MIFSLVVILAIYCPQASSFQCEKEKKQNVVQEQMVGTTPTQSLSGPNARAPGFSVLLSKSQAMSGRKILQLAADLPWPCGVREGGKENFIS